MHDAILPLSKPIKDEFGNLITEIPVSKGTTLQISVYGYNRNKDIWGEDATMWKPERWLKPLPDTVRNISSPGVFSNM